MFEIVPVSFVLDWNHPQKLEEELKKFIFYYCENHPCNKELKKEREYIEIVKILSDSNLKFSNFSFDKCKNSNLPAPHDVYKSDENSKYIWMLKPSELNRGRGLSLIHI